MTKKKSETTKEPPIKELSKKTNARKLNEKVLTIIKHYLKIGVPIVEICKAIKVSKETFYRWKNKGEEDFKNGVDSLECDFYDSFIGLQNYALIFHLENVERIADQATNIGEYVVYIGEGKVIKHHHFEEEN